MARRMVSQGSIGAQRAAELIPLPDPDPPKHEHPDDGAYTQEMTEEFSDAQQDVQREIDEANTESSAIAMMWGPVVESVTAIDVSAMHERLYRELSLGGGVTEYGAILHALDAADRNIVDAARLERAAKLEQERVDREVSVDMEVMRTAARRELEVEKSEGKRSKAPTLEEVRDRMLNNWPSKVAELEGNTQKIHAVRAVCETLTIAWRSRASSLRAMADRYAARRDPTAV